MVRGPNVTSNWEHGDSVFHIFTCVCGKLVPKKLHVKCVLGACSNTTKLTWGIALDTIPFHGEMMLKRRNVRAAGHLDTSEGEIRWSVLSISNQIISLDAREEGILQTSWLKWGEIGIMALWHRLMQPLLHLIWETAAVSQHSRQNLPSAEGIQDIQSHKLR